MIKEDSLKKIIEVFSKFFSFYIIYSPVLVAILFPMLFLSGIFFLLFYFWEFSWTFADPLIIWEDPSFSWLNSYLFCFPFIGSDLYHFIQLFIFLVGLILFLISLGQLIHGLRKEQCIVRDGFYKYVRHPQNLSIIIMVFPFFILHGIRIGNLISWVQFIFFIIIYSDLGDTRLKKKYPKEFQDYYENTGFMFPRLLPYNLIKHFSVIDHKKLRYFIMLLLYIFIIGLFYLFYIVFPFYHPWI
ncbi:MAG: methyltransferase family protein [Promethearchaeota archaeon]